jgi:hypothetical protein
MSTHQVHIKEAALMQVDEDRRDFALEAMGTNHVVYVNDDGNTVYRPLEYGPRRVELYFTAALTGLLSNPNITGQNMNPNAITVLAWTIAQEAVNTCPGS